VLPCGREEPCLQHSVAEPVVSIITPAFNAERFLRDTGLSVIAQSFSDFEWLIVDDGSQDGTLEIAREFATADSRIKVVVAGRSRRAAAARNCAMAKASGRYFALLDSDDLWDPSFLAVQIGLLERSAVDVVTSNAYNLGGALDGLPLAPVTPSCRTISFLDMLEHEDAVCIHSVFRRAVYDSIGGFDERLTLSEDYDFWLRAARAGFSFLRSPAPLARYRRRTDSASANEAAMLEAVATVLRRTRAACLDSPRALAIIDRQVRRFEARRRLADAKFHLLRGEYRAAADEFEALADVNPTLVNRTVARASRYLPVPLLWAYRTKSAFFTRRSPANVS
jgi:teichuronic acid biosynthesis glycosyltransferase TuaG